MLLYSAIATLHNAQENQTSFQAFPPHFIEVLLVQTLCVNVNECITGRCSTGAAVCRVQCAECAPGLLPLTMPRDFRVQRIQGCPGPWGSSLVGTGFTRLHTGLSLVRRIWVRLRLWGPRDSIRASHIAAADTGPGTLDPWENAVHLDAES